MKAKRAAAAVIASAALAAAAFRSPQASDPPYDLIIRHGTVVDGSGLSRYQADVALARGHVARIGDLAHERSAAEIDAAGLIVAPGFINIHSHAAANALPTAANMLTQGVTTEILNPDGGGSTDIAAQLSTLAAGGLAVNVGAYVGFNSAWAEVVGPANRRATPPEIDRMRAIVTENLARGAWGLSAGLDYKPAYFASTDEVVDVARAAAPWRTIFPNHDRLTPETGYSSRAGIGETIAIGERAGLVPVVTHMKIQGREQGRAAEVIGLMDAADARGHYTAADAYPYLAGQTSLEALIIPAWAQDGGRAAMLKRLADPSLRPKIVKEAEEAMDARFNGAAGVYLPATQRQLVDVMREMDVGAGEAVVRLVEQQSVGAILRFGSEPDLVRVLQRPSAAIACDCGASLQTRTHPRFYGTFPRVLGHYVRETHALTLEDAVRKMTGLPASTIGIVDRGLLEPGMAADVTGFDPDTIIDHATYEDPARPSDGVRFVVVNGVVALERGAPTGARGGAVLARSAHMPSRPMDVGRDRRVHFEGWAGSSELRIDVEQKAGARAASGIVRLQIDAHSRRHGEMRRFGLLQTADGWASVTGELDLDGATRAATIVVDRANPLAADHRAAIEVDVEGGLHAGGAVAASAIRIVR
jgi:N-acyl-D-aspartate/D-glutamate deacylase